MSILEPEPFKLMRKHQQRGAKAVMKSMDSKMRQTFHSNASGKSGPKVRVNDDQQDFSPRILPESKKLPLKRRLTKTEGSESRRSSKPFQQHETSGGIIDIKKGSTGYKGVPAITTEIIEEDEQAFPE